MILKTCALKFYKLHFICKKKVTQCVEKNRIICFIQTLNFVGKIDYFNTTETTLTQIFLEPL